MEKTYLVVEQHFGDKQYWAGEHRVLREQDAENLIKQGLLAELVVKAADEATVDVAAKAATEVTSKAAAEQEAENSEKMDGGDLLDKAEHRTPKNKAVK